MIAKILILADGSDDSCKAPRYAMEIASKVGARVDILHVLPLDAGLPCEYSRLARKTQAGKSAVDPSHAANLEAEWRMIVREVLEYTVWKTKAEGVDIAVKLRYGRIIEVIDEEAKKGGYDMIVMGSSGAGSRGESLLGSVSSHLSRYATCPVLIAH